jgi:hypothetical protein
VKETISEVGARKTIFSPPRFEGSQAMPARLSGKGTFERGQNFIKVWTWIRAVERS